MKNFGLIKTIFTNIMANALISENIKEKKLYNSFANKVKRNKILKAQFEVYDLLENCNDINENNIDLYLKEAISLLENTNKNDIINENLKLFKPIIENYSNLEDIDYPEKNLHESISELIFLKKNAKTINKIIEHSNIIKESIKNNKTIVKETNNLINNRQIPTSLLKNLMVERFKEKYSTFGEIEKLVFMSIIKENVEYKKDTFNFINGECLTLVNKQLAKNNNDLKETLLNVKEKLLIQEFNEEEYNKNILKTLELYNDLK